MILFPLLALAAGPSFECTKAKTRVEKLLCSESGLAESDKRMAESFAALKAVTPPSRRAALVAGQKRWLRKRDACVDKNCLEPLYDERNGELSMAKQLAVLEGAESTLAKEKKTQVYRDEKAGFSLELPASLKPGQAYTGGYHTLIGAWSELTIRTKDGGPEYGEPLVEAALAPEVIVRVGRLRGADAARACAKHAEAREDLGVRKIGDTEFHAWSFGSGGMNQWGGGVSLKALRDDTCWAVEAISWGIGYAEGDAANVLLKKVNEKKGAMQKRAGTLLEGFRFLPGK